MAHTDLHESMMRVVERLEREPRFSLAWMLAYGAVLPRVLYLPVEKVPEAIEEATKTLVDEIRKTASIAKYRRRARAMNALLDRVESLKAGRKIKDNRRRPRRKAA